MSTFNILKTPDSAFSELTDYPDFSQYTLVDEGLEMHYLDNKLEGSTIVMLHGEPSWSYLYRKMIGVFHQSGWRCIAPDLIGFGKSDKIVDKNAYSYQAHYKWLRSWWETLNIKDAFLFVQDWGGLLGLRLFIDHLDDFKGLVIANTFLPKGLKSPNKAFQQWKSFAKSVPSFPVGDIINMGTTTKLSNEIIAAYNAPYPDESYKVAPRVFPELVPYKMDDPEGIKNRGYWEKLSYVTKPVLTLFSDSDPIMNGLEKVFQENIPGCQGQPHEIIKNAGHFLQEDKGEEIANKILNWKI